MDPFKLLQTDHRNVAKLFDQLEAAGGSAAKLRVFEQIKTELELHTHIEEKVFYPALEEPEETHDLTLEAYEEHDVVKKLLSELSRGKNADEEWEAQAKVLRENVEHHVEEEENELFPKAEAALSEEEVEELGDRLQAEKSRKQSSASKKASSAKKASKKTGAKKSASKATKKSGSKKSAAKAASRSTAAKRSRSKTKKSAAKKR